MAYKHLLLEVYCLKESYEEDSLKEIPSFCKYGSDNPGYHCISENCKYVRHTYAPFEIAYAGEFGEVPDSDAWIGFGGEMEPLDADENKITELRKTWEKVCRKKYKRHMKNI